jgi:AcrR family transcriptional regulator
MIKFRQININGAISMPTTIRSGPRRRDRPAASLESRRLGRPKDERIDTEVVAAVLGVLKSRGYRAVTIESIARRVKRARTSLYRRWPSKRHLVAFAVIHALGMEPAPNTGSLRKDLVAAVDTLRAAFAGILRHALAGLLSDMAHDRKLAAMIRVEVLERRRQSMRLALARGKERGEIAADLNVDLILDMLTAPYYFRALFGHAPIDRTMNQEIVDYVLRAAAPSIVQSGIAAS